MKPTTMNNVCCTMQGSIKSLLAGWHTAFRGGGSVGEES
jgi:hypothetical protein